MSRGSLITAFSLQRLVVDDDERGLLVLARSTPRTTPRRRPCCTRAARRASAPSPEAGPLGDRQHLVARLSRLLMSNTATDCAIFGSGLSGVSTHRCLRLRVRLDEQRCRRPGPSSISHDLPGVVLVLLRVGADQRDLLVAEVAGRPDRAELRVHEVRAAARVRDLVDVDQRGELAFLRVDHRDLVRLVRGDQEVALASSPSRRRAGSGAAPISVTFRLLMSV